MTLKEIIIIAIQLFLSCLFDDDVTNAQLSRYTGVENDRQISVPTKQHLWINGLLFTRRFCDKAKHIPVIQKCT